MEPSPINMDARNEVVGKIGDIMYSASTRELKIAYVILHSITTYIESEPHIEKKHITSLLRNISSNIIMVHSYRDNESSSESETEK